jgi:acyl-coenzyme A synthetase/AMP-(fatty) acid ligase
MPEKPRLTSPRGSWTFSELSSDPFKLMDKLSKKRYLRVAGIKSEEVVSAVLSLDGKVSAVFLGDADESIQPGSSDKTQWGFLTSGSTGIPKHVFHTLKAITRELPRRQNSNVTWAFLTDINRMAGFQVVLEAVIRGENLAIPDRHIPITEKVKFLKENNVTHISATPSQFRQLLGVPKAALIPLRQITLGGEIADQKILDGLHDFFPGARITHVYATTETGPIFGVSDGQEGFPESQLKKIGNRITISETLEVGIISKNNSGVFWTGDLVEERNGRYHFIGRNSEVINVGGAKVFPSTVEAILLSHPDVQDCIVKGEKNSILGQLVVAEVSLRQPSHDIVPELRKLCKALLPNYSVPQKFSVVNELRFSLAGKKMRG